MEVPRLKYIVEQIYALGRDKYDLTTKSGCGDFTRAVVAELHEEDPGFGELLKDPRQNHVKDSLGRRVAVDAVLYKPTNQAVDIIGNSATPKAKPAWTVDKSRPEYADKWAKPASKPTKEPGEPPTDPPKDPQEPVGDIISLQARVDQLEKEIGTLKAANAVLEGRVNHDHSVAVDTFGDVFARLKKLENQKLTLKAKGHTNSTWGHRHEVEITLEEVK